MIVRLIEAAVAGTHAAHAQVQRKASTRVAELISQNAALTDEIAEVRETHNAAVSRAWAANLNAFNAARSSEGGAPTKYAELLEVARQAEDEAKPRWLTAVSGKWAATGADTDGPGVTELLFLTVHLDGSVTGRVDDGDGVEGEEDCVIANGRLDTASRKLSFDQVYSDNALTRWSASYDREGDRLLDGVWSGECDGTFTARRVDPPSEVRAAGGSPAKARPGLTEEEVRQRGHQHESAPSNSGVRAGETQLCLRSWR